LEFPASEALINGFDLFFMGETNLKSILQTREWAEFKKTQGFEILTLGELFIHKKNLPFGQNFLYLPEVSARDISAKEIESLKAITKEQKSIFARLELTDQFSENAHKLIRSLGFQKSFEEIQPKWRQIIDLTKTRGTLLSEMKQKGRYNVRLAQRKGVQVQSVNFKSQNEKDKLKALKIFYSLYKETNEREGLKGRDFSYFQNLIDKFKETDYLEIYIATYQNEPVAAALVSFYDNKASYLYGGSSRRYKEVMAPYLLHWQIILSSKERGFKVYDLVGRARPGDNSSKWAGITRFKEQFGGQPIEILGSYDYINKPFWYRLFKIAEKIRRRQ